MTAPQIGDIWKYTTHAYGADVHDYYLILDVKLVDRSIPYPWETKLQWMGSDDPDADEEPLIEVYDWPEDGYGWTKVA